MAGTVSPEEPVVHARSLLMFSWFYYSFAMIWVFIRSITGLLKAKSHLNQLLAAPDVPFPAWNIKEVTTAQSSAQHMTVIPSSDPSININHFDLNKQWKRDPKGCPANGDAVDPARKLTTVTWAHWSVPRRDTAQIALFKTQALSRALHHCPATYFPLQWK